MQRITGVSLPSTASKVATGAPAAMLRKVVLPLPNRA
jgi:hypothetical protein